ncbi:MAG: hypothetical protein IPM40_07380 [Gammaproteobacteria bacterium]|nr:hypothetical protein [Gammaproteobacteria bacterium]
MRDAAARFRIGRLNVATHGATAALIDPTLGEDGLVLPVLDYEFDGPAGATGYDSLRPAFAETLSPALPAGLNLGRQLWWQQQCFPGGIRADRRDPDVPAVLDLAPERRIDRRVHIARLPYRPVGAAGA